jgi:hypothetical protein
MKLLTFLFLLVTASDPFSRFSYCRENSRGPYELQCVNLDADGKGEVRFKRRGADEIKVSIELSAAARDHFLSVVAATNYLDQGDTYESGRKVADLGRKTLSIDLPSGNRQADFNYSTRKEVIDLVAFFDALINQETIGFDIDNALQFDRLSIPKRLEQIENELKANRIGDPDRLIPTLDKIQSDSRLMNYARTRAGKIKEEITAKKTGASK